nr:ROK family protein [uncultured Sphingomonas sp.]
MTGGALLAGIELGGTKAIAVVARDHEILDRIIVPTDSPDATLRALRDWLGDWAGRTVALGIASFGPVRIDPAASDYGRILETPKAGWAGADVIGFFQSLGLPIAIDTDVNAAAIAEHRWGAGRGVSSLTYVTIGTGVGGGTFTDGHTIKGRLHPEIGHLLLKRVDGDDFGGNCRFHRDCVEGLIAGPSLAARFGEPPAQVARDDPRWSAPAHDLAMLLVAILHSYAPERLLVGGGVTLGAPWLLDMAIDRVAGLLGGYYPGLTLDVLRTMIVPPALGGDAGPLGAIALAMAARDSAVNGR